MENISTDLEEDLRAIDNAPVARFDLLAKAGRLDPRVDFRNARLAGVPLAEADLRGFDFTGSDLRGTMLRRAIIDHTTTLCEATLDDEDIQHLRHHQLLPLDPLERYKLREQADAHQATSKAAVLLGDPEGESAHFKQALELYTRLNDHIAEANCRFELGRIAFKERRFTEAVEYIERAKELFRDAFHSLSEADCNNMLGKIYLRLKKYADAEASYISSLEIYKWTLARYREGECLLELGEVSLKQGSKLRAMRHLQEALDLAISDGDSKLATKARTRLEILKAEPKSGEI